MGRIKRIFTTIMECIFFIGVMFILFYMVACITQVFFNHEGQREAVPIESEFSVISSEGNRGVTTLPANFNVPNTSLLTAKSNLPDHFEKGDYLCFYASFQTVHVYINGQLRGSADGGNSFFATDVPANHVEFIPLRPEDQGGDLVVTYASPLYNYKGVMGRMCIGTKEAAARYLFSRRLPVVMLGMFVFFFGMILLGVGISKEAHAHINRVYMLLGYAAIFMGAWFVLQSCMCQVFFSDVAWIHWIELMCFIFVPVPLLLFMDECTHGMYWNLLQPFCIIAQVFEVLALVLTIGSYDAMRFISLIHLFLVISILFAFWILVDIFRTNRSLFKELYWVVAGFAAFFASAIVEGVEFYTFPTQEDGTALAFGVSIFFICNYIWLQKQRIFYMAQEQSEKKKAQSKNLFLANMSHEIRTPVNTILIANAMIARQTENGEISHLAKDATRESKKLLAFINDILDYSKVSSHHMKLENSNYDMVWFLRDLYRLAEKCHEEAPYADFRFTCNPELPSYLFGDEAKIRRVMENILRRGFSAASSGGLQLMVDFQPISAEEGLLLISSEIDGVALSEARKQRILDVFNNRAQFESFEVDLNLIDGVLRLMEGEIEYTSTDDGRNRITLRIPQRIVEEKPIGTQNAESVEHAIMLAHDMATTILLVDDEAMNHHVFHEMVRGENLEIIDANSGEEALELVQKQHFDIIFMDNQMDGRSGIETSQAMEELEENKNRHTPKILMTAASMSQQEYQEAGFVGYLQKPLVRQDIFRILKAREEGVYDEETDFFHKEA